MPTPPAAGTRLRANGEAIQALRTLRQPPLSVSALATNARGSRPYLSNIERGARPYPGADVLTRIAKALGVGVGAITTVETIERPGRAA